MDFQDLLARSAVFGRDELDCKFYYPAGTG